MTTHESLNTPGLEATDASKRTGEVIVESNGQIFFVTGAGNMDETRVEIRTVQDIPVGATTYQRNFVIAELAKKIQL